MAKITKIAVQEKDKTRCNIYLDGEFAFALSAESVYSLHIKKGDELTEKQIKEFTLEGEKSKALSKAISYVSKTLKTNKQVKTYLYGKGFTDNVVYYVTDKLKEYGYVDDFIFAKRYIESNYKTKGKRLLECKLMEKGVSKDNIKKAFYELEITFDDSVINIAIKHFKNKEKTYENLSKTYKYLIGKGFSYAEAEIGINAIKEGIEED